MENLDSSIRQLIGDRSGGVLSHQIAWTNSIQRCLSLGMSTQFCLSLLSATTSPNSLSKFAESAGMDTAKDQRGGGILEKEMTESSDNSNFSFEDWVEAIEAVLSFLEASNRKLELSCIIGYVACAGEFATGKGLAIPLKKTVEQMLADYGVDG